MMNTTGKVYVDVHSRVTVLVTGPAGDNSDLTRIVTVTPMGDRVRPRTIASYRLTGNYLTLMGKPRKRGYVEVGQFPTGHLLTQLPAVKHATGVVPVPFVQIRTEDANLGDLSDDALVLYLGDLNREYADAKARFEAAKGEAKSRAAKGGGLIVLGDVTVEMYPTRRVTDSTAKENLPPERYAAVCTPKIDAKLARLLLTEAELERTLGASDWTLKVRDTTEEDREKLATTATDAFGRPVAEDGSLATVTDLFARAAAA